MSAGRWLYFHPFHVSINNGIKRIMKWTLYLKKSTHILDFRTWRFKYMPTSNQATQTRSMLGNNGCNVHYSPRSREQHNLHIVQCNKQKKKKKCKYTCVTNAGSAGFTLKPWDTQSVIEAGPQHDTTHKILVIWGKIYFASLILLTFPERKG